MPYVLVSTQIRLETGPTLVGDEHSDPVIMTFLGARKTTMLGNNFSEYHVDDPPRVVLDKLEKIGFRVVTMTGVGQTLVWCLHREAEMFRGVVRMGVFRPGDHSLAGDPKGQPSQQPPLPRKTPFDKPLHCETH